MYCASTSQETGHKKSLFASGGSSNKTQSVYMIFYFYFLFGCMSKQSDSASQSDGVVEDFEQDSGLSDTGIEDSGMEDSGVEDTGDDSQECELDYTPNPFISDVVSYSPGEGAGFGQDQYPNIVKGPPMGMGENAGSLDVLSLGEGGDIVVSFSGLDIIDGDGADLIVFENPFIGWTEIAIVSASMDGETWVEWPCDLETQEGCAGVNPVLSHPDNCIDARDVEVAGGDAFDLAEIGMSQARFIRIQDAAVSGPGGFDLDAAVIIHHAEQ